MNKFEILDYWKKKKDQHKDRDAVGVDKRWDKIKPDFEWIRLNGKKAWARISKFYPPNWNNWPRMKLSDWISQTHPNYQEFIEQERGIGKFQKLIDNEISDNEYIAFYDKNILVGMLVDGNHRFIDINYLIEQKEYDLSDRITACVLDIFIVDNLSDVIPDCGFLCHK